MEPESIYCHAEAGEFPTSQFRRDENGKLKVPYVHDTNNPHYVTGEFLDEAPSSTVRGGGGLGGGLGSDRWNLDMLPMEPPPDW